MRWGRIIAIGVILIAAGIAWWIYRALKREPAPEALIKPIGTPVQITAPSGLPPVPIPPDNPPTVETVALGRKLYYDTILSVDKTTACSTCHSPGLGFTDGKRVSEGAKGQEGRRNAPTLLNTAYNTMQFCDGRAPSLETVMKDRLQSPTEMAHTLEGVERRLMANPVYEAAFAKAFGPGPIKFQMVAQAIASFERTMLTGDSPFDRYLYGGDKESLSKSAERGLEVFRNPKKGNCAACHSIGESHALFTDNKFHNLGVGVNAKGKLTDLGRYAVTKNDADRGAFKTPTLRNIALTAPYMHDGSVKTLREAIDLHLRGGNPNPYLDKEISPRDFLSEQEREELVAFLQEALTGPVASNLERPEAFE